MKNMSFKSYLESKGASARLDEGLKEIRNMIWPDMDLYTAMTVMQNSPTWTPAAMRGKLELSFKSEEDMRAFVEFVTSLYGTAFGSEYSAEKGWDTSAWYGKFLKMTGQKMAGGAELKIEMAAPAKGDGEDDKAYRKRTEQKFSKEFGSVMAVMKIAAPESMKYVRRDKASPGTVVTSAPDEEAAKIFRVVRYVEGLDDEKLKSVLAAKAVDVGELEAAAPEDEVNRALAGRTSASAVSKLTVESYFNGLLKCYETYDYLRKGGDRSPEARDRYVAEALRPGMFAEGDMKTLLSTPRQSPLGGGTTMVMSHESYLRMAEGFDKDADMLADVDETSRWMLKSANQLLKPGEAVKAMAKLGKEISFLKGQVAASAGDKDAARRFGEQLAAAESAYAEAEDAKDVTPDNLQDYLDRYHIGSAVAQYENVRRINLADVKRRAEAAKEKGEPFDEEAEKRKIPGQLISLKGFS